MHAAAAAATDSPTPRLPALPVSTLFIIGFCKHCAAAVTLDSERHHAASRVNYHWLSYKPDDRDQSFLLIACDCTL